MFSYPKKRISFLSYDDYWEDKIDSDFYQINAYQKIRADFITKHINEEDSILDVGCGNGAVLRRIRSKMNIDCIGVDISSYALNKLESEGIKTIKKDLMDEDIFQCFDEPDHILFLEVLEHIVNSEEYLLRALEKANKSVFFSFPNTGYISFRLRFLSGKFPLQWITHPSEHVRFWTKCDLLWWLKALEIDHKSVISYYGGVPILNKLMPSLFSRAFIVKVAK